MRMPFTTQQSPPHTRPLPSRTASRAHPDSRPRPLIIPGRRSDVRLLIEFFNTQSLQQLSPLSAYNSPIRLRATSPALPQNKVKSLVVNFNRLEAFSSPATLASSPVLHYAGGRGRTFSLPPAKAVGVEKNQFGRGMDAGKVAEVVNSQVEEITVSGGDRRETTYRKDQEPFRSVKVWKEVCEARDGRSGTTPPPLQIRASLRVPSTTPGRVSSTPPGVGRVKIMSPRNSKVPVDGPGLGGESMEAGVGKHIVKRRRRHRNRGSGSHSEYASSNQESRPSPIQEQRPELRFQKSRSPMADGEAAYRNIKSPVSRRRDYIDGLETREPGNPKPQGEGVYVSSGQERKQATQYQAYQRPTECPQGFKQGYQRPAEGQQGSKQSTQQYQRQGKEPQGSTQYQPYRKPKSPVEKHQPQKAVPPLRKPRLSIPVGQPRPDILSSTAPEPQPTKNQDETPSKTEPTLKASGDMGLTASKHSFPGALKETFMSVFRRTPQEDVVAQPRKRVQLKEPTTSQRGKGRKGKRKGRKLVPAEYEGSSSTSIPSEYEHVLAPEKKNSVVTGTDVTKPKVENKFNVSEHSMIITTETTLMEQVLPDIETVIEEGTTTEGAPPAATFGNLDTTSGSPEYPASNVRQPRTFKDIALQRREERLRAAQEFQADNSHPSVQPLRVVKTLDPAAPAFGAKVPRHTRSPPRQIPHTAVHSHSHQNALQRAQSPPHQLHSAVPPQRVLYSKASQETLTSFEEPSIHVISSSSESSSEIEQAAQKEPAPQVHHQPRKIQQTESTQELSADITAPAYRSPTLMREMGVPRLSLRTDAMDGIGGKPEKTKRAAITTQNFAPRMKLKADDGWKKLPLRKHRNTLLDGISGTEPARLEPPRLQQDTRNSSTSHDTTVSSVIAANTRDVDPIVRRNSDGDDELSPLEVARRESDFRLMASMRAPHYSKVNFSNVTQNFPAVDYLSQEDGQVRIGDRTTVFDGAGETGAKNGEIAARGALMESISRAQLRIAIVGVKKRIQRFEDQQEGQVRELPKNGGRSQKSKELPKNGSSRMQKFEYQQNNGSRVQNLDGQQANGSRIQKFEELHKNGSRVQRFEELQKSGNRVQKFEELQKNSSRGGSSGRSKKKKVLLKDRPRVLGQLG